MNIFLTGSSGFLGSYLLGKIIEDTSHNITILLRNKEEAWRIRKYLTQVSIIEGDLGSIDMIEQFLFKKNIDTFVHLAWTGVAGGDRNSPDQWRNVPLTLELVDLAKRLNVKNWIGVGSQAEYGPYDFKINEEVNTRPTTLYGASKLAACELSMRLCLEYNIRFAWLRLFSSYGPMDNDSWLIPYLIKSLSKGGVPKLTSAEQIWDYIYIKDAANAIYAVMETADASGIFNLGSGNAVKLKEIILKIRDLIDPNMELNFGSQAYRSDQVMHLEADISKLQSKTGWHPKFNLDDGIRRTVEWFLGRNT